MEHKYDMPFVSVIKDTPSHHSLRISRLMPRVINFISSYTTVDGRNPAITS